MLFVFVIFVCIKLNDNCLVFLCVYDVNLINIILCIFCMDLCKD